MKLLIITIFLIMWFYFNLISHRENFEDKVNDVMILIYEHFLERNKNILVPHTKELATILNGDSFTIEIESTLTKKIKPFSSHPLWFGTPVALPPVLKKELPPSELPKHIPVKDLKKE